MSFYAIRRLKLHSRLVNASQCFLSPLASVGLDLQLEDPHLNGEAHLRCNNILSSWQVVEPLARACLKETNFRVDLWRRCLRAPGVLI